MSVGGHPGGVGSETPETAMSSSRDHCDRLTIRLEGSIGPGFSDRSSGAWSLERASALVFLVPGR